METYINSIDKDEMIKKAKVILDDYQETLDLLDRVFGCVLKSSWNFGEISSYACYGNHEQALIAKMIKYDKALHMIDNVSNTLNKMKPIYAEVLILKYRQNYSIDMIIEQTNLSRSNFYRILRNAYFQFIMIYER